MMQDFGVLLVTHCSPQIKLTQFSRVISNILHHQFSRILYIYEPLRELKPDEDKNTVAADARDYCLVCEAQHLSQETVSALQFYAEPSRCSGTAMGILWISGLLLSCAGHQTVSSWKNIVSVIPRALFEKALQYRQPLFSISFSHCTYLDSDIEQRTKHPSLQFPITSSF